jgi:hypothetical protein
MKHKNLCAAPLRMCQQLGYFTFAGMVLAVPAASQPAQSVPTISAPVSELLASSTSMTISNGQITAHIAPPGPRAFYQGTRFDQAGVVTSLKMNGREFYGPWFDRTSPKVLDYTYDTNGAVVGGPDSATSGPVEEFGPLDFPACSQRSESASCASPIPSLTITIDTMRLLIAENGPSKARRTVSLLHRF